MAFWERENKPSCLISTLGNFANTDSDSIRQAKEMPPAPTPTLETNKQKRYSTSHSSLEFQTWVGNATHIKLKLVVFDISIDEIKNNCNRFLILLALKNSHEIVVT